MHKLDTYQKELWERLRRKIYFILGKEMRETMDNNEDVERDISTINLFASIIDKLSIIDRLSKLENKNAQG